MAAQLQRQGIPPAQANSMAQQALGNVVNGVAQLPQGTGAVAVSGADTTPVATVQLAFDDEGNLMPGVVNLDTSFEDQQAQLQARLSAQGLSAVDAEAAAVGYYKAPLIIRDEAAREAAQAQNTDEARLDIDEFEPGSSYELLADAGLPGVVSDAGPPTPRWLKLSESLRRLTEVDTPFLVERNQLFLKAQIGKYEQLETQARDKGDVLLARSLNTERSMFESTLTRLDARLLEIDYGVAALRYADRLASKPNVAFTRQEIVAATQRLVAGASTPGSAVDAYVRDQMASEDTKLLLTIMGGGSIGALVGQDGTGAGSPRLQRVPGGSAQAPGTGYKYNFDKTGRVESARAELKLGEGTRSGEQQRAAGGSDRRGTDDGGHIVGNRFNPPTAEFNLFAQDRSFNRGVYSQLEKSWAAELAAGKSVVVEWKFTYAGSSVRPDGLLIRYSIDNGKVVEMPFRNMPRGGK